MTITTITNNFSVSGELSEQELINLGKRGVSTLINVRPDNEASEQKTSAQWKAICKKCGMEYFHIPVSPCQYSENDIKRFQNALNGSDKKVHSFCRTGARAIHLYALANKDAYTFEQLQTLLKDKGYDLDVIADKFNK